MSAAIDFAQTPVQGSVRSRHATGFRAGFGPVVCVLRRSLSFLATGALVLAAVAFLMLAVGPRLFGYQTSTMLTGSMSPLINPGDVLVTRPVPANDIRVGDVITYHIPIEDLRVETHRVTEVVTNADGSIAVRTKGDANNGVDPWLATISGSTVDRHVLTVPHLGQVIRAVREPLVLNTLMYGAPAILVVGMLASIWIKKPEQTAPAAEKNA
ncbi:signal peptidase I [Pseudarthrobacter sp. NPDC058329]|uniref:signal peptidase I n=1 Tax=Pseudarthrobacter sp. NPDC058329 TaxID=3346448 RepID=UPI0036D8DC93